MKKHRVFITITILSVFLIGIIVSAVIAYRRVDWSVANPGHESGPAVMVGLWDYRWFLIGISISLAVSLVLWKLLLMSKRSKHNQSENYTSHSNGSTRGNDS